MCQYPYSTTKLWEKRCSWIGCPNHWKELSIYEGLANCRLTIQNKVCLFETAWDMPGSLKVITTDRQSSHKRQKEAYMRTVQVLQHCTGSCFVVASVCQQIYKINQNLQITICAKFATLWLFALISRWPRILFDWSWLMVVCGAPDSQYMPHTIGSTSSRKYKSIALGLHSHG